MHSFRNEFFTCLFKIQNVQVIQNDVIKCCKMMSSNVALLHSNNCCVLEPAICEDLDLHVVIFINLFVWAIVNALFLALTPSNLTYIYLLSPQVRAEFSLKNTCFFSQSIKFILPRFSSFRFLSHSVKFMYLT